LPQTEELIMMISELKLQNLLDRDAIRECIFGYCRGIDRVDEAALRASYWPDATDSHGAYKGSASGFIDAALPKLQASGRMIHHVGNISIHLHGEQAAVETYFLAWQRDRSSNNSEQETFLAGRYVDRFEKRDDEWRVAARVVVYDWVQPMGAAPVDSETARFGLRVPIGGRKPDDPWYRLLAELGK
jgi:SnoaL-like domain